MDLNLDDVKQAMEAEQQAQDNTEVTVVPDDDQVSTGHKVIFYVILGLIGLSGVGIPVLIWLLIREHKKVKQLTEAKAEPAAQAQTEQPVVTEEKKDEEPKKEEKAPESKK